MPVPTPLIVLGVVIVMLAALVQPFVVARRIKGRGVRRLAPYQIFKQRSDLLAERNRIYGSLARLEHERRTGSIDAETYQRDRAEVVQQGVAVLRALDGLPPLDASTDDPVEAAVRRLRRQRRTRE